MDQDLGLPAFNSFHYKILCHMYFYIKKLPTYDIFHSDFTVFDVRMCCSLNCFQWYINLHSKEKVWEHTFIPGLQRCLILSPSRSTRSDHVETGFPWVLVASSINCKPSSQTCRV